MKFCLLTVFLLISACSVNPAQNPIQTPGAPETPQPLASNLCITPLTTESVNIRRSESVRSDILGTLKWQELKTVLLSTELWYKVKVGDTEGYIANWVVQKVPCSQITISSASCFIKVSDAPEVFVKGSFEWSLELVTPQKVAELYRVILKHYSTDNQAQKLYVEFSSDREVLFSIFPVIDDGVIGVTGYAVLSSDACTLSAGEPTSQSAVQAIVVWVIPSVAQLGENVDVLIHELSHAAGAQHGGNDWMDNAYFWGPIGRQARYENMCKEYDEPQKTICDEFREVMTANTEKAG